MIFPQLYDHAPLINYIDFHISNGKKFHQLPISTVEILVGYALEAIGPEAYVSISETDDDDLILHELINQMKQGGNKYVLGETLCNVVTSYFHNDIKEIFKNRQIAIENQKHKSLFYPTTLDNEINELSLGKTL